MTQSNITYSKISAQYIDHMGTDLTVVNAARASFGKESEWDYGKSNQRVLKPNDAKLIRFLATGYRTQEWEDLLDTIMACKDRSVLTWLLNQHKNKAQHWAPFAHAHIQIRIDIPIFLARQLAKHQVGGIWSEESRRYIEDNRRFYEFKKWHDRPDDVKQGSGQALTGENARLATSVYTHATKYADEAYSSLRELSVAPEEARAVLGVNLMTTATWTGSLLFWARMCNQRMDSHAQLAAQDLAKKVNDIVQPLFPVSWGELINKPHPYAEMT